MREGRSNLNGRSLNALAKEFHAANQKWWHDPATGEKIDRDVGEMFALMHSELSECLEGFRKSKMDDHLPHRKAEEVELADFMIRLFDFAGAYELDLDSHFIQRDYPFSCKADCINQLHNTLSLASSNMLISDLRISKNSCSASLTTCIGRVIFFCNRHDLDIWGAIDEKAAYNRIRADHTNAARLAVGGKKF